MSYAMVIDDDEVSRDTISHFLERDGYTVWNTVDHDQALKHCKETGIDLLVADIVLHTPFSGTDLALALRNLCPSVPILLVSGTPVEGWPEKDLSNLGALAAGPVEFLMKPFTARAFTRKVARLLNRAQSDSWIQSALEIAKKLRHTAS